MTRKVFYSFHYEPDNWRASTVRNIGTIEGNKPAHDNDWEEVKKNGDTAIENWINNQMSGKSCIVVLVGEKTADRKWINYEIKQAWKKGKGVVGIYIDKLLDKNGYSCSKGNNPFSNMKLENKSFSEVVKCYTPSGSNSKERISFLLAVNCLI